MQKKKILIVEDEKDFVIAISALLEAEEYEVTAATDGLEGLEKIKAHHYDLIIMDVMMPKMDGYKLSRMVKFDAKYAHTPIIMLTAKAQDQDRRTGEECGADAYVLKSQNPDVLLSKVKELIKK
ncbi:MAG: two-component system response regulator [Candidatus Omnitrophica bacterium CG_4_8_14_3_um_filter_43_15]|nr:MAG: hypothetical protein AUJ89_05725 [Candidatus Omnitrophica bacterium CG1_02_43_210]PIR66128.1 MAG: two-component system response regulator [Candidatus Omnitrophica bacterium CG10_big_fil_rev_8_21_14_0_10_43_8]PIV12352.1 MAG: two-component system response regulator [Candidatus Omnitrophica bacterium CG03_land_8_20_14_0_80_43_22]PIW80787.1 MAG: two-component system response regulator [Candidatus Omnitrophica bacterium CG_4_8_14_3_um_filter_43_15]PIY84746.1 MAG: two-component system respons